MSPIKHLNPDQIQQIASYREKWEAIALSTRPIDPLRATAAIQAAYLLLGKAEPNVQILSGIADLADHLVQYPPEVPGSAWGAPVFLFQPTLDLFAQLSHHLAPELLQRLQTELINPQRYQWQWQLQMQIMVTLSERSLAQPERLSSHVGQWLLQPWMNQQQQWRRELQRQPVGQWVVQAGDFLGHQWETVQQQVETHLWQPLQEHPWMQARLQDWNHWMGTAAGIIGLGVEVLNQGVQTLPPALFDFSTEVLGCELDTRKWLTLRSLGKSCPMLFPFEHTCFVIDRPVFLSLDEQNRLHAEGEAAIEFGDGSLWYAFHGVFLPERYGRVPPQHWQAHWLLHESNAELRRVLIQGIGYDRLCQELDVIVLDVWREYTLLRIAQEVDVEPIHLLKMICPSTGHLHITRVPPTCISAREAIRWVNGGIDPEDFGTET